MRLRSAAAATAAGVHVAVVVATAAGVHVATVAGVLAAIVLVLAVAAATAKDWLRGSCFL